MSYPFYGKKFAFSQPDGTRLDVRGWGDQHHAAFETLDGYTLIKDPDSDFYCYAGLSDDQEELVSTGVKVGAVDPNLLGLAKGLRIKRAAAKQKALMAFGAMGAFRRCEVRRERAKTYLRQVMMGGAPLMAPPRRQTLGRFTGLCLLVQFSDVQGTITRQEVDDFCNLQGYNGFGNNGSVYDYFYENSNGRLEYTNSVVGYYTARHPRSYYTNPSVSFGIRARELVKEALEDLKGQNFDFSRLSVDDENYVYAVNVFYAGSLNNGWSEGLWPHSWSLATPFVLSQGAKAYDYQITDIGQELSLATFCHENGHMVCDYPDLYDYGYESRGVGDYCLMCAGGGDEKNPTNICAYLKYKSGWASRVTAISGDMAAQLSAQENEFYIYPKNMGEYFIIENRQKRGRDLMLPASGLALWHVDELGSNNDEHMTITHHYECSLEQADNQFDLEKGLNNGDPGDLFQAATNPRFTDSTAPDSKWWDGTPSGLVLSGISESGLVMTFHCGFFEDQETSTLRQSSAPGLDIPDNDADGVRDTITITEDATLTTIKISADIVHTYRGDLKVTLEAPSGMTVLLHNRSGGRAANLKQIFDFASTPDLRNLIHQPVKGPWTLWVQDLARVDEGRLNRWEIEIQTASSAVIELEDSAGENIPDNVAAGIQRSLTAAGSGTVKDMEVSVDITHSYIGDLRVTLISPANTHVELHGRTGGGADNIIQTYSRTTTPALASLVDEPVEGQWKLHVADLAGRDVGKLNRWALKIVR